MDEIKTIQPMQLTSKGLNLLAKAQAGASLRITHAVIGEGYMIAGQTIENLTSVIKEIPSHQTGTDDTSATVDITCAKAQENGRTNIRIKIQNGDKTSDLREFGIMADDPDEGEIMYAYANLGNKARPLPASEGKLYISQDINLAVITSNATDINVNISLPAEVSYKEFEDHRGADVLDHPDKCVRSRHLSDGCIQITHISDEAKTELLSETQSALQKIQYGVRTWQDVRDFKIDYSDTYDDNQEYRTVAIKGVTAINMLGFDVYTNYPSLSDRYMYASQRSGFCSTIDDTGMEITTEFFVDLDSAPKESDKVKHTEI